MKRDPVYDITELVLAQYLLFQEVHSRQTTGKELQVYNITIIKAFHYFSEAFSLPH